ncbi:hypothetical protein jhhlp_007795 [Lomentospora prolificans]|uniref:U6 small nuclear RNA (adenine-(43)-N(6))-methyltransferase n=1 Tax=Lomentospora prolificans TaxID=41688 RepID=A0A2N3N0N1_9PEZI|nr:hypothetical protein jhhlp_007795 [Lomentospora prolificans]
MATQPPSTYSMSGALPDTQYLPQQPPYTPSEAQMLGPAGMEQFSQSPRPPRDDRPGYHTTDPFRPQRVHSDPGPIAPAPSMTPMLSTTHDIVTARSNSQYGLKEFVELVKRRQNAPPGSTISSDIDAKIRASGGLLLKDLKGLRLELREVARNKESHRWRRWLVGGAMATFFPAVKAILRLVAPSSSIASNASTDATYQSNYDLEHASNDTEYAFRRSKTLLERIRTSVLGRGGVAASFAFFVFAALYVFQNEVALRVAKTLSRRVKKLVNKVEDGGFEVDERDLKTLEGWRWRVLLWGSTSQSLQMTAGVKRRRSSDTGPPTGPNATSSAPRANRRPQKPREPGVEADTYYRTLYMSDPDFRQLSREDSDFAKVLKNGQLDFNDPDSVVQLTKTLLKADFGLTVELPPDRLCPPVPNRHNYILWLKDLLDTTSYQKPQDQTVKGLDIGTGASCVYPLLGCAQRNWTFVATDIDEKSLSYASKNISSNSLTQRVILLHRTATDPLIPTSHLLAFTMTNPPFYTSQSELEALAKKKSRPPHTACTGSASEMVTAGGEVAFVKRIIEESLTLKEQVRWYTAMLGKHSSVEVVVDMLRDRRIDNYAVTEFVQGSKTRRWAVGWSFGAMRPEDKVCRGMDEPSWHKVLPHPVVHDVFVGKVGEIDLTKLGKGIAELGSSLELISWEWDEKETSGRGRARQNVWSRAWRRKKMRAEKGEEGIDIQTRADENDDVCAIGFKISVVAGRQDAKVVCRWVEGHDHLLLDSLLGFLRTRVGAIAK